MDGIWTTKSEGVGLTVRVQLSSKISNLCDPPTLQSDRRTDGRHAIARTRFALSINVNQSICIKPEGSTETYIKRQNVKARKTVHKQTQAKKPK